MYQEKKKGSSVLTQYTCILPAEFNCLDFEKRHWQRVFYFIL